MVEKAKKGDVTGLDPKTRLMLTFAEKITLQSSTITRADIDELRRAGLSDEEIFDLGMTACFVNHMDRVADFLGVEDDSLLLRVSSGRS